MSPPQSIASTQLTTTELLLGVNNPLLVVLAPYSPKNAWWQERKGTLSLLTDGVIEFNSDHIDSLGKTINVSHEYFKQALRDGWSVYMAYCAKPTVWYDFNPVAWGYESDRVIISADTCDWKLSH
jgi:hypothetical protein